MKLVNSVFVSMVLVIWSAAAHAQDTFIQVEARPDLNGAQDLARALAAEVPEVNGFRMASGWYGVAIGPFTEAEAATRLDQLRAAGVVPADAFLTGLDAYIQQFYPVGTNLLAVTPRTSEAPAPQGESPSAQATAAPAPAPVAPRLAEMNDPESQQDAYRAEAQLGVEAKMDIQRALQWYGFYQGAIDAAFGPGTRGSIAAWQQSEGVAATGVLTTLQRSYLVDSYTEILASLGLDTQVDDTAGISMQMPLAMVAFDRYEPPFAHYTPINDSGVTVLLLSQTGDEATLLGLYDIMQTLEIVPLNGERSRAANSFTLTGENAQIKSYTYAMLTDGAVKGFTLIWPAGEDRRFNVALRAMRDSFRPIAGQVLPDAYGDGALTQSVDLVSGLKVRRPESARSGFYVDGQGSVLTSADSVASCGRITLDEVYEAEIAAQDEALGLALLKPTQALAPVGFARFLGATPRLQSEVAVSGYSYEGILGAPTLTFGTLADARGLEGQETMKRLALAATPGDAGGPVFDTSGAVLGMLLPEDNPAGKRLPGDVSFATDSLAIAEFLSNSGVSPAASEAGQPLSGEELMQLANGMTVLVSCWE